IQSYWRSLFPRGVKRYIIGGLFNRDFYLVSVADASYVNIATLLCHLPSRAWTTVTNTSTASLTQARTSLGVLELYSADANARYANVLTDMLNPTAANAQDGDGTPVTPSFQTRDLDGNTPGLKAYSFGRASYNINIAGFQAWQATHSYALNELMESNTHLFKVTTAGTSGATVPLFNAIYGQTTTDGSVVWTNVDPQLSVSRVTELGGETTTFSRDLRIIRKDAHVSRDRFEVFGDYQAVSLYFTQRGPSAKTNLYYVELEARLYAPAADFNTGPSSGTIVIP
ncbi:MAG TPA: hypothetical protein VKD72_36055, partial [Gemmataceae bacterium]|nr:hypothetical protein [Gemmataceae bacterium]